MKNQDVEKPRLIAADDKLCDVIARDIDLLPVVLRFGIGSNIGQATVDEVCAENGIDPDFFLAVINTYHTKDYFPNIDSINLSLLIDFLTRTHLYHRQVTIPLLERFMKELKVKLPDTRLVITLENYLKDYVNKLNTHNEFEERKIFPLASRLAENSGSNEVKTSAANLRKLFNQHVNVETEIGDLIMVIIQHIPKNADQQLFHDILHTLSHFEKEQIDHARFEDKILVPRILKLFISKSGNDA